MQFRNLTPFDAMAFDGVDAQDREYHVVALAVSYTLRRVAAPRTSAVSSWQAVLDESSLGQDPIPLCLADQHWGDPTLSSLARESDLVPYKPRCDVRVVGNAYCSEPRARFSARLLLRQGRGSRAIKLIDKTLQLTGPRHFERTGAITSALLGAVDELKLYHLSEPEPATCVPLRYELAYGGSCQLPEPGPAAAPSTAAAPNYLINEVCYRNPLGRGWVAKGYLRALARTPDGLPQRLPAPQISLNQPLAAMTATRQGGPRATAPDAVQMSAVPYPEAVAGFAPLGKAWAPRLPLAGTYDDAWLRERHPNLPPDFDFAFWNGAPQDQQIDFPDFSQGLLLAGEGLSPDGQPMQLPLPAHRALVLMRLNNGLVLPIPMQADLIELDNHDPQAPMRLRIVWRAAVLQAVDVRVLEARFEVDPQAPLLRLKPSRDYQRPDPQVMARERVQERAMPRAAQDSGESSHG